MVRTKVTPPILQTDFCSLSSHSLLIWTFPLSLRPSNSRFCVWIRRFLPVQQHIINVLAVYLFFWLFLTSVFLSRLPSLYSTCMRGHIPSPTLLFPSHSSSVSTTGNRWEVKGVTCRGNGLLPLACQAVITCLHTQNLPHFRGEEKLSWQPLQVPSKCTHTCSPRSWWERPLTLLCPFQSSSALS